MRELILWAALGCVVVTMVGAGALLQACGASDTLVRRWVDWALGVEDDKKGRE